MEDLSTFFVLTLLFYIANRILGIEPDKKRFSCFVLNVLFLDRFLGTPTLTPNAWSLTFEIWYYFITFFFVRWFNFGQKTLLTAISVIVFFFFLFKYPITVYFVLGVVLSRGSASQIVVLSSARRSILQIVLVILIFTMSGFGVEFGSSGWPGLISNPHEVFLPLLLFAFMYTLLDGKSIVSKMLLSKPMLFLGGISYSLYLIHPYSYLLSRRFSVFLLTGSKMLFPVFIVVSMFTSIAFAFLVNRYFEGKLYLYFVTRQVKLRTSS